MPMLETASDFDKQIKAAKDNIKSAAKKSDSKILKSKAKEMERRNDNEAQTKVMMVRKLVDEGIDMFMDGEMEFKEMIKDLNKALTVV